KGVLLVDRERQPFQFVPKISEEQILKQRTREFVDLFFDGRPVELALRLVESSDLSEESIQRLEAMLVRHRELESGEDSEEVQK
ncbi:MAG: BlaI/MecI/CopY family transcriptional regulator, partial [Acidobacteriota bacterium]